MKQVILIILIISILSCNRNNKCTNLRDNFQEAEKEYSDYNSYKALDLYKSYIKKSFDKNDTLIFKAYSKLLSCYYKINDLNNAENTFKIIDSLYKCNFRFKNLNPEYYNSKAFYYKNHKNYAEAIKYFKIALSSLYSSEILLQIGKCYKQLNQIDSTVCYLNKALSSSRHNNDLFTNVVASCYSELGYIYFIEFNDFYKAKLYYDSVLYTYLNCNHLDSFSYANNLSGIGYFYQYFGFHHKALQYLEHSDSVFNKLNHSEYELMNLAYFLGHIYGVLNKIEMAQNKIDIAISYFQKNFSPEELKESYYQKAYLHYRQREYHKAIFYYKKALDIILISKLKNKEKALSSLAWCYTKLEMYDSAEYYFTKCIPLMENLKFENINTYINFYGEYSRFLIKTGEYKNALKKIEDKFNYVENIFDKKNIQYGYFIYWRALAFEKLNKLPESLKAYQDVVNSSLTFDVNNDVFNLPIIRITDIISHENLIDAIIGKADVLIKMASFAENRKNQVFYLNKSLEHYSKARELTEIYNKSLGYESDRIQFTGSKATINEFELSLAIKLFRLTTNRKYIEKGLTSADNAKAVQLSNGLNEGQIRKIAGIPDSINEQENNMKSEILLLQNSLHVEQSNKNTNQGRIDKIRKELLRYNDELKNLINYIEKKYPKYTELKYSKDSISFTEIRNCLRDRTVVEYAFTSDSLYIFVLTKEVIRVFSQPSAEINASILSYIKCFTQYDIQTAGSQAGFKNLVDNSFKVYKLLLEPYEKYFNSKEITVVPNGLINFVSLDALLQSDSFTKTDYGTLHYLLQKYSFSYAYSLKLMLLQEKMPTLHTNEVVAFAPVYDDIKINSSDSLISLLKELPDSKDEAVDITRTFGGKAYIGKKATKEAFRKESINGKILHFAMHGKADMENPMNSGLYFYDQDIRKGYLTNYELYSMKINSPLVVLSSCNSGTGVLLDSEGFLSLSRGFIYAGCPSLITTLWQVNDDKSASLMQYFYENLKEKRNIDVSLQKAKIKYLKTSDPYFSHPYYWAGYIQTGKTSSFIKQDEKQTAKIFAVILGSCSLLLIIFFILKKKN